MRPGQVKVIDGIHLEIVPFLRDTILERAKRSPSQGSNNVGGWKSSADLFAWPGEEIRTLRDAIIDQLRIAPLSLHGWAMVNRTGSEHKRHTHGLQYTCGVYYVSPGDPAVPTIFEIQNWETSKVIDLGEKDIAPLQGRLVLFSGATWHRVPKYNGIEPRISIAFEARP